MEKTRGKVLGRKKEEKTRYYLDAEWRQRRSRAKVIVLADVSGSVSAVDNLYVLRRRSCDYYYLCRAVTTGKTFVCYVQSSTPLYICCISHCWGSWVRLCEWVFAISRYWIVLVCTRVFTCLLRRTASESVIMDLLCEDFLLSFGDCRDGDLSYY